MPLSLFPPDDSVLRAGQGTGILAWGVGSRLKSLPALNRSHESLCVGKAPEKADRVCFGRQSLCGAGLNTRPGELVAEDAEVTENWAHVGHGREAQGPGWVCGWGRGDPERRQKEICRLGGRDGMGRHVCPAPPLGIQGSVWSLLPSQPRHSSSDGIKQGDYRGCLHILRTSSEATATDGGAGSLRE